MSKLTEQFRARGVHNLHEFYRNQPHIWYRPREIGRGGSSPRWIVRKQGTVLSDAWYDYGAKTFVLWKGKAETLIEAQAFASEKFGVQKFGRDPFCGYGDAEYIKTRTKEILALPVKDKSETQ